MQKRRGKWGIYFDRTLMSIAASAALWICKSVVELKVGASGQQSKLDDLGIQIAGAQTAASAKSDVQLLNARLDTQEVRIESVKQRVEDISAQVRQQQPITPKGKR